MMMSRLRRMAVVCSCCTLVWFLPGCWDYEKINDRAQIMGIGVDPVPGNPSELSYTFQIPVFQQTGGQGGQSGQSPAGASSTKSFRNITVTSTGINTAISWAQTHYSKMLYLSNVQSVVLSQKLSGGQVQQVLSELLRNPSTDKLAWLLVTPLSARALLGTSDKLSTEAPADTLDRILSASVRQYGFTIRERIWQFWRDSELIGIQPHAGLVRPSRDGQVQVYGLIAFKKTEPSLVLGPVDTLYYNFVAGSISNMSLTVRDGSRSFEVAELSSKSDLSVSIHHHIPILHVRIRARAVVAQDESRSTRQLPDKEMRRYEMVMAKQIAAQSDRVIRQLQGRKLDVYGFGRWWYLNHPSTLQFVLQHWDDAFAHATTDIQVQVTLPRKGDLV